MAGAAEAEHLERNGHDARRSPRIPTVVIIGGAMALVLVAVVLALVLTGDDEESTATGRLVAGGSHTCALRDEGRVACWGHNRAGGLGDGSTADRPRPVEVAGLDDAVAVSAGAQYSCALRSDGQVACWGWNAEGRLGNGTDANRVTEPVDVEGLDNGVALSAGWSHACAAREGGRVSCWGSNSDGQLGDGSDEEMSAVPVEVADLDDAVGVSAGTAHTCALREGGRVSCWGSNADGQLGDGTTGDRPVPTEVEGLDDVVAVSAGAAHTCALREGGAVSCWGSNGRGQLGDGTTADQPSPVETVGVDDVVAVSAGAQYSCALRSDGGVMCWGSNSSGRLGDGSDEESSAAPVAVDGLDDVVALSAGWAHACALWATGDVSCWGSNENGRLGDGTDEARSTPVMVVDLGNAP